MKGIVFTEFLDMVEDKFGYDLVDKLLTETELESGGIYTAVGTYNYTEMVELVINLSKSTGIDVSVLLNSYGQYFFGVLLKSYPQFFQKIESAFYFLESIERHIHVEVRKLYPEAELPTFDSERINENTLKLIYYSERKLSDFAEGLITKTMEYFKEAAEIIKTNLKEDGSVVQFVISKNPKEYLNN